MSFVRRDAVSIPAPLFQHLPGYSAGGRTPGGVGVPARDEADGHATARALVLWDDPVKTFAESAGPSPQVVAAGSLISGNQTGLEMPPCPPA